VASRRERALPGQHSVERAVVNAVRHLLPVDLGLQMHQGERHEQLLGVRFGKSVSVVVPLAALNEHAVYVAAFLRLFLDLFVRHVVHVVVVERDSVNGDLDRSDVVLFVARDEGLGEEETREPELDGGASIDPVFQEVNPIVALKDPRGEAFQRQETDLGPQERDLVVEDRRSDCLQVFSHHNFADDSTLDLRKGSLHDGKESVVADAFLEDDCVHGLEIVGGELIGNEF